MLVGVSTVVVCETVQSNVGVAVLLVIWEGRIIGNDSKPVGVLAVLVLNVNVMLGSFQVGVGLKVGNDSRSVGVLAVATPDVDVDTEEPL